MKPLSPFNSSIVGGIWRLWLVAQLLLLVLVVATYLGIGMASDLGENIMHTFSINREMRILGQDLTDAETGQRGYLLTHNKTYLQPYEAAIEAIPGKFAHLEKLIRDPKERANLEEMHSLSTAKLNELAKTISLEAAGRHEAAMKIVLSGQGKQIMDKFRVLSTATLDQELKRLTKHKDNFINDLYDTLKLSVLGGILFSLLLFTTASRISSRLLAPIKELLGGLEDIAREKYGSSIQVSTHDEIGQVANSFNEMAEHIQIARDAQNATQKDLERSNAELENFAYVASHDLKSPLRGMRSLAQWIEEDIGASATEETSENLRLLKSRVDRLENLLESLLAYSRVGRKASDAKEINPGKLVGEIVEYLAPPQGFTISCANDMPILDAPHAPLELVLRNLISNAIKHHDLDHGHITVGAKDLGDYVEFSVKDDGPGIPPEFQERIFQMFQTLKPRDQVEGCGMGLAIVKKTIEHHGGRINVISSPPVRGSEFQFTWEKNMST